MLSESDLPFYRPAVGIMLLNPAGLAFIGRRIDIPALAIEAVDTTGAGDTFVGVLAAALDHGLTLEAALHRASAAAGLACLAHGAQTATPDRLAIDKAVARLSS